MCAHFSERKARKSLKIAIPLSTNRIIIFPPLCPFEKLFSLFFLIRPCDKATRPFFLCKPMRWSNDIIKWTQKRIFQRLSRPFLRFLSSSSRVPCSHFEADLGKKGAQCEHFLTRPIRTLYRKMSKRCAYKWQNKESATITATRSFLHPPLDKLFSL